MIVTINNEEITVKVEHTLTDISKAISILESLRREKLREIVLLTRSNNLPPLESNTRLWLINWSRPRKIRRQALKGYRFIYSKF